MRACSKHGEHSDWSFRKPYGAHKNGEWRCRPCDRERQRDSKDKAWRVAARQRATLKVRERNEPARSKYRRAQYNALLLAYGAEVADSYWRQTQSLAGTVNVAKFLMSVVCAAHPSWSHAAVTRAIALNRIAQKPLTGIGWSCRACYVESDNPSFFDIDHIIPRATLKRINGSAHTGVRRAKVFAEDKPTNLQVLCPNCHRCKTLDLQPWFEIVASAVA